MKFDFPKNDKQTKPKQFLSHFYNYFLLILFILFFLFHENKNTKKKMNKKPNWIRNQSTKHRNEFEWNWMNRSQTWCKFNWIQYQSKTVKCRCAKSNLLNTHKTINANKRKIVVGNALTASVRRFSALSKDIYVQAQNNLFFTGIPSHKHLMKWKYSFRFMYFNLIVNICPIDNIVTWTSSIYINIIYKLKPSQIY